MYISTNVPFSSDSYIFKQNLLLRVCLLFATITNHYICFPTSVFLLIDIACYICTCVIFFLKHFLKEIVLCSRVMLVIEKLVMSPVYACCRCIKCVELRMKQINPICPFVFIVNISITKISSMTPCKHVFHDLKNYLS